MTEDFKTFYFITILRTDILSSKTNPAGLDFQFYIIQRGIPFVDKDDDKLLNAWLKIYYDDNELLTNGGVIDLFLKCRKKFQNNTGLLDQMIVVLSNIVNIPDLRPKFFSSEFVEAILKITETEDATYSSRLAMEILVNFISDGKDAWKISNPSYDVVSSKLETTLNKWDVNIDFFLAKNTFEDCFRLLGLSKCQKFALWILASATRQTNSMYLIYFSHVL